MYVFIKKQNTDLYHDIRAMGRNNFSYEGAKALMDYLCDTAESSQVPIEYDPISFCCEFTEYKTLDDILQEYAPDCKTLEDIEQNTEVIKIPDSAGFIMRNF